MVLVSVLLVVILLLLLMVLVGILLIGSVVVQLMDTVNSMQGKVRKDDKPWYSNI